MMVWFADENLENADWTKGEFDVRNPDGSLVRNVRELATAISPLSLAHFMDLPAARAMPAGLRRAVRRELNKS